MDKCLLLYFFTHKSLPGISLIITTRRPDRVKVIIKPDLNFIYVFLIYSIAS